MIDTIVLAATASATFGGLGGPLVGSRLACLMGEKTALADLEIHAQPLPIDGHQRGPDLNQLHEAATRWAFAVTPPVAAAGALLGGVAGVLFATNFPVPQDFSTQESLLLYGTSVGVGAFKAVASLWFGIITAYESVASKKKNSFQMEFYIPSMIIGAVGLFVSSFLLGQLP